MLRRLHRKHLRRAWEFAWLTLPALVLMIAFVELPFIMSVTYSFTKWNGLDKVPKFVGLANYAALIHDDTMFQTFGFTLKFAVLMVVLVNVVALLLAVILDGQIKGRNILRAAIFVPYIISLIVVGFIWKFIFYQGFDSLYGFTHFSLFHLSWLGNGQLAYLAVVLVSVWQAVGFYLVVYLAGLQTVPHELIEAATIDGAGRVTRFFRITLPLIMASITVCVFYSISNSLKTFDVIFSLTGGGPGTATTSVSLYIYQTAFIYSQFGYGTAQSVVLFLIIMAVTVLQLTLFKQREVEV